MAHKKYDLKGIRALDTVTFTTGDVSSVEARTMHQESKDFTVTLLFSKEHKYDCLQNLRCVHLQRKTGTKLDNYTHIGRKSANSVLPGWDPDDVKACKFECYENNAVLQILVLAKITGNIVNEYALYVRVMCNHDKTHCRYVDYYKAPLDIDCPAYASTTKEPELTRMQIVPQTSLATFMSERQKISEIANGIMLTSRIEPSSYTSETVIALIEDAAVNSVIAALQNFDPHTIKCEDFRCEPDKYIQVHPELISPPKYKTMDVYIHVDGTTKPTTPLSTVHNLVRKSIGDIPARFCQSTLKRFQLIPGCGATV